MRDDRFEKIFLRLKLIPKFLKDTDVALSKKILILLAIGYIFSPLDLIPDPIIILGWIDDIIILLYSYSKLSQYLDKYMPQKSKVIKFKRKDIIDDAEYEIEDKK
ncbi:DUF1232 domain-containing protein [Clostridium sp. D2Q-14]|nr:DUF1232 domain-containing protein [Anaeromonas gelatinilytica]